MTRAKALKDYFKKFYDIDAEGMTAVDVTQDFLKKKYDYDSEAATYTGVIQEIVDNELSPGGGGDNGDFGTMYINYSVENNESGTIWVQEPATFSENNDTFNLSTNYISSGDTYTRNYCNALFGPQKIIRFTFGNLLRGPVTTTCSDSSITVDTLDDIYESGIVWVELHNVHSVTTEEEPIELTFVIG